MLLLLLCCTLSYNSHNDILCKQVVAVESTTPVASDSALEAPHRRLPSKVSTTLAVSPSKDDGKKEELAASPRTSPSKDKDGAESQGGKSLTLSQAQRNQASRFRTEEDLQRASFIDILKDQPALRPFKLGFDRCLNKQEMEDLPVEALSIDDLNAFHQFQDKWDDAVDCVNELMSAATQASNDVVGHIKGEERTRLRKEKAEALQREKYELKKIREHAAQAAQAVRQTKGKKEGPAIFAVDFKASGHITPVPELAEAPTLDAGSWDRPFFLEAPDDIKLFFGNERLRKAMSSYAVSHKQTLQKANGLGLGRDQVKIDDADVLEVCSDMMTDLVPEHDISEVQGGENFMKGMYLFGYDSHPRMQYIGFTPSQGSMIKFMFVGKVKTLLIKLSTLVKVSSEVVGPPCESLEYFDGVGSWDAPKLKQLSEAGVCMYEHVHSSNQMLFIPQGWVACEATLPGAPSHYGIRKAFFMKSEPAIIEYEATISLSKHPQKMSARRPQSWIR